MIDCPMASAIAFDAGCYERISFTSIAARRMVPSVTSTSGQKLVLSSLSLGLPIPPTLMVSLLVRLRGRERHPGKRLSDRFSHQA